MNDCERCGVEKGLLVYDGICRACNDELFVVFWEGQQFYSQLTTEIDP